MLGARSALTSVLFSIRVPPLGYDPAVGCTIRGIVIPQFEGLTRITLVAFADAILGLDQQTFAHDRHRMDGTAELRSENTDGQGFLTSLTRTAPAC
jgi:hypothetical protein